MGNISPRAEREMSRMPGTSSEANVTPQVWAPELSVPAGRRQPILERPAEAELPPPNTIRWVARRKAAVVAAVQSGTITLEEACRRYQLSEGEFLAWQRAFEAFGERGLRATRLQQYRSAPSTQSPKPRL